MIEREVLDQGGNLLLLASGVDPISSPSFELEATRTPTTMIMNSAARRERIATQSEFDTGHQFSQVLSQWLRNQAAEPANLGQSPPSWMSHPPGRNAPNLAGQAQVQP